MSKKRSGNPLWRTDIDKISKETGQPVRFQVPDGDASTLPQLDFPLRAPSAETGDITTGWEDFTILMIYEDDTTKLYPVLARDSDDALNKAMELNAQNKDVADLKIKTWLIHDGIGDVVARLATGIEKYGTKVYHGAGKLARGASHVVEAAGHVGAEIGRGVALGAGKTAAVYSSVKREYATGRLERLIDDAGGNNPARRAIAKAELKRDYPQIYSYIAWEQV